MDQTIGTIEGADDQAAADAQTALKSTPESTEPMASVGAYRQNRVKNYFGVPDSPRTDRWRAHSGQSGPVEPVSGLRWPSGLAAIQGFYGNPRPFQVGSRVGEAWPQAILVPVPLPAPLFFADRPVHTVSCHRLVAPSLQRILGAIRAVGNEAWASLSPYGGCYCWRLQRGGDRLSTHSWAIAVDFGVSRNPRGQSWADFPPVVLKAFRDEGWIHGLNFPTPDPMHWQACSGY